MITNSNLHKAKDAKNDEFYTQLTDVAKELMHYKAHFKDKIVLCNCNDPTWSAFWGYFHLNFTELKLKKLIATSYCSEGYAHKLEYSGSDDNDVEVCVRTSLKGNGDFRSQECLDLLTECDIVVTNPPFSLFREYVALLMVLILNTITVICRAIISCLGHKAEEQLMRICRCFAESVIILRVICE